MNISAAMDDRSLENAAWSTSNTTQLSPPLTQNSQILDQQTLSFSSANPLHMACESGNLDLVKKVLQIKPQSSHDLNPEGFSPLHIASANGYVEIVREMASLDPKLCRIEGKNGITPLHVAAVKGKTGVIRELISWCNKCAEDVTIQRETALSLAARNSQFRSISVIVEWIVLNSRYEVLNIKDEQGNNVLHLAAWKKQRQVLELLLVGNQTAGISEKLEVNAINEHGLTPLDVLQLFPSEAGDREIQELLRNAGALRSKDLSPSSVIESSPRPDRCDANSNSTSVPSAGRRLNVVEYFKYHKGRDSPSHVRDVLLIIAVLVATATYQVGVSPPGGVWQDNGEAQRLTNNGNSTVTQFAGKSILGTYSIPTFVSFAVFNSIGFSVSLVMINILTGKFPLQLELSLCLLAMSITYNISIASVAPQNIAVFMITFTSILPALVPVMFIRLRDHVSRIAKLVLDKLPGLRRHPLW